MWGRNTYFFYLIDGSCPLLRLAMGFIVRFLVLIPDRIPVLSLGAILDILGLRRLQRPLRPRGLLILLERPRDAPPCPRLQIPVRPQSSNGHIGPRSGFLLVREQLLMVSTLVG